MFMTLTAVRNQASKIDRQTCMIKSSVFSVISKNKMRKSAPFPLCSSLFFCLYCSRSESCMLLARQGTCVCQSGQCWIVNSRHIVLLPVSLIQIGLFQIMSVRICLTCRSESLSFSNRILDCQPGEALEVGRADTLHRADTENAFFNCKVSLKVVMMLKYFGGCSIFSQPNPMYAGAHPNLRHMYHVIIYFIGPQQLW